MAQLTIINILDESWWIAVVAMAVSLIATPVVRFIAYRYRIVDRPDELLKPHGRPIAYLGGLAMCAGLLVGLACCIVTLPNPAKNWEELKTCVGSLRWTLLRFNPLWNLMGLALSSIAITIVGLLDDLLKLKPRQKILGQVLAAGILLLGGVGFRMSGVVFSLLGVSPPDWVAMPAGSIICVITVIATCNATNFLDGLDGLCGGVTGIIALGFLGLAVFLAQYGNVPGNDELRVGLCLAMAGAVLGFLPYNVPPASIFMGDAGSMLLGFFVAAMMALFCREGTPRWFLAAWVVFALPTLDTSLAVVRRFLAGKSIFAGDRSHLYDQLVDRGMTVKRVVILFYFLAAVAAAVGVSAAAGLRLRYAFPIYVAFFAAAWVVFHKRGMIRPTRKGQCGAGEQGRKED